MPEDTRVQHIQQMQSFAFWWGKSDIPKAYRRRGEFAMVLEKKVTGDWELVTGGVNLAGWGGVGLV
jgi:hypothetical protein